MAIDKIDEYNWYVIHTYAGYENKVKENLEKIIENRNLQDFILRVEIPVKEVVKVRNGKKRTVVQKMFPTYVLVKMIMNDNLWSIVRHTNGVTGFVGPGSKPSPLSEKDLKFMGMDVVDFDDLGLEIGDEVKIISGPFDGSVGNVLKISKDKRCITVNLFIFEREMPVDFEISQLQKL
ncbi:MAG: transcription termination/antitermination factor NusG [Firmicutes bacterium]|nr:transcription termination/antitermination factor NusG [Bacillota bacterium]